MNPKNLNVLSYFVLIFLLVMAFAIINGKAGSLEPTAPPGPTMVTLDQLNAKIDALSSPVEKVVHGTITLQTSSGCQAVDSKQSLSSTVDPNRCVAILSEAVASVRPSNNTTYEVTRNGACLVALTPTEITVRVEGLRDSITQTVSYQIIQYK